MNPPDIHEHLTTFRQAHRNSLVLLLASCEFHVTHVAIERKFRRHNIDAGCRAEACCVQECILGDESCEPREDREAAEGFAEKCEGVSLSKVSIDRRRDK